MIHKVGVRIVIFIVIFSKKNVERAEKSNSHDNTDASGAIDRPKHGELLIHTSLEVYRMIHRVGVN
jgi:hypothetical protein